MASMFTAAINITNKGTIKIGWTLARAELLKTRPVQYFVAGNSDMYGLHGRKSIDKTG